MIWEPLEVIKHDHIQMTHSEFKGRDRFVISFNARALMELPDKCDCHHHGVIKMAIKGLVDELILYASMIAMSYLDLIGMNHYRSYQLV